MLAPAKRGRPADKPPDTMTSREASLLMGLAMGKTYAQAAEGADYTGKNRHVLRSIGYEITRRHSGSNSRLVAILAEDMGFDLCAFVRKLIELVNAEAFLNVRGELQSVPDNSTQLRAMELLAKILNVEAPKKIDVNNRMTLEQWLSQISQEQKGHLMG